MDSIVIEELELRTRIGVPEAERANEQRVTLSVELFHDLAPAANTDDVTQSIDYKHVTDDLKTLCKTPRATLERLAEDAAAMILKKYTPSGGVKICARKFVVEGTKSVSITIFRK